MLPSTRVSDQSYQRIGIARFLCFANAPISEKNAPISSASLTWGANLDLWVGQIRQSDEKDVLRGQHNLNQAQTRSSRNPITPKKITQKNQNHTKKTHKKITQKIKITQKKHTKKFTKKIKNTKKIKITPTCLNSIVLAITSLNLLPFCQH